MKIIGNKQFIYFLILIEIVSLVFTGYLHQENRRISFELSEKLELREQIEGDLNASLIALEQVGKALNETREEIVATRVHLINILLPQYGLYTTGMWNDLGVQSSDLAVKSSPLHTFVIIYPRSLVPDKYAETILRICIEARNAISEIFGLSSRFPPDRRVLIVAFPWISNEFYVHSTALTNGKDVITLKLQSKEELTEKRIVPIAGLIHEVAHLFAILDGYMNEGVAIYLTIPAFYQVVKNLGDDVWPVEVNATEIIEEILNNIEEQEDPSVKAARILVDIAKEFGDDVIGEALLELEPVSTWQDLKNALIEITKEPDVIQAIFEEHGYSEKN